MKLKNLQALARLGLPPEHMAAIVAIIVDELAPIEERRAKDRARKFHGNSTEIPSNGDGNFQGKSVEFPSRAPTLSSNTETNQKVKKERDLCTKPPKYTPNFETFWQAFPTDKGMSKAEAFKAWKKLNELDQKKALECIPAFKVWVTKQGKDYRTVHAVRYISQRRFDGFADVAEKTQAMVEAAAHRVYVQYGTDAGDAWEKYYRNKLKKLPPRDGKNGWWFDSEYPMEENHV